MDINNTILPFGEYFLLTLRTGAKKALPLFLTLVISFVTMMVVFFICMIPIVLVLANNLPFDILQNRYALEYYIYSGEIFYELIPVLPTIAVSFVLIGFFSSIIQSFQNAMIYTITDSSVCHDKRSFGKMFSFAIKRTFPTFGTAVVLSLIYIGIYIVFMIAVAAIAIAMGIDISSVMYYEDISAQMQLGVFTIISFILLLIMLAFMVVISLIYSMSIFARVKYKFSGISSLRYSRLLTKGKRGKIFGNMLLFGLIFGAVATMLSFASSSATDYGIPFIPFLIQLAVTFIGILVSVFWAVIFINLDNVKGKDIINNKFPRARNIKDAYFPSEERNTYNQNSAQQECEPDRSVKAEENTVDTASDNKPNDNSPDIEKTAEEQIKADENNVSTVSDNMNDSNSQDIGKPEEEQIQPEENNKTE